MSPKGIWKHPEFYCVGTVPDREAAQRIGCTVGSIAYWRGKLGLPRVRDPKGRGRKPGAAFPGLRSAAWTEEALARLGKESDADIAKSIGLTRHAVAMMRQRSGIPTPPPTGQIRRNAMLAKRKADRIARLEDARGPQRARTAARKERDERVCAMRKTGASIQLIAERVKLDPSRVWRILAQAGFQALEPTDWKRPAEPEWHDVADHLWAFKATTAEIAERCHVTRQTVRKYLHAAGYVTGRWWKGA